MFKYRYHIIITSLILSCILWLSLNLNLTYEIQRSIPVRINVNRPYAIASYIPQNLDVKVKGRGWNLLRLYTSLTPEFNYDISPKINEVNIILTKQILNENPILGQNLTITSAKPETLFVKIGRYEEKYVQVKPRVFINCREGYQTVGSPIVEPDSVKVGGASFIIGSLDHIYTSDLTLYNVNSGINEFVRLSDTLSNIIWRSQDEVNLRVKVELTAQKVFHNIEIAIPDIPSDREVLLIPQFVNVQLKGGVDQLSLLHNSQIKATVDFKDLLADTTGAVTPRFSLPEGTEITSVKPDKIQYVIKNRY
jgi:YbbR domain-containing protein